MTTSLAVEAFDLILGELAVPADALEQFATQLAEILSGYAELSFGEIPSPRLSNQRRVFINGWSLPVPKVAPVLERLSCELELMDPSERRLAIRHSGQLVGTIAPTVQIAC